MDIHPLAAHWKSYMTAADPESLELGGFEILKRKGVRELRE
jgi:hypothetical protein